MTRPQKEDAAAVRRELSLHCPERVLNFGMVCIGEEALVVMIANQFGDLLYFLG
ncbi:hypothetical protein [Rhodococcus qingshengii]